MKVDVSVDVKEVTRLAERFPQATAAELSRFTERVGSKIEREAKYAMRADVAGPNRARSRTGNLVRQIRFVRGGPLAGAVRAFANYSGFVHGEPFHKNRTTRKENPFFTTALGNSELFIQKESSRLISGIMKRI